MELRYVCSGAKKKPHLQSMHGFLITHIAHDLFEGLLHINFLKFPCDRHLREAGLSWTSVDASSGAEAPARVSLTFSPLPPSVSFI